jgi:hypothetical protein
MRWCRPAGDAVPRTGARDVPGAARRGRTAVRGTSGTSRPPLSVLLGQSQLDPPARRFCGTCRGRAGWGADIKSAHTPADGQVGSRDLYAPTRKEGQTSGTARPRATRPHGRWVAGSQHASPRHGAASRHATSRRRRPAAARVRRTGCGGSYENGGQRTAVRPGATSPAGRHGRPGAARQNRPFTAPGAEPRNEAERVKSEVPKWAAPRGRGLESHPVPRGCGGGANVTRPGRSRRGRPTPDDRRATDGPRHRPGNRSPRRARRDTRVATRKACKTPNTGAFT